MAITPSPIFQKVIDTTVPHCLFRPAVNARLEWIIFYNTSVSGVSITLWHDIDGEVYDNESIIYPPTNVGPSARVTFEDRLLLTSAGCLAIKATTADAVTVTGYGWLDL